MNEPTIVSSGRRGNTIVPNFRWEDLRLDPFDLRIAGWISSHTDSYRSKISRNEISRRTGISVGKVTASLQRLEELGIIAVGRANGNPVRITLNVEVWEDDRSPGGPVQSADRSRGGLVPDHEMTGTRPPRDHIEEQSEQQGEELPASTSSTSEPSDLDRAKVVVNAWWESLDIKPAQSYMAIVKIVAHCLKSKWPEELIAEGLRAVPTVSGASLDLWRNTRDSKPDATIGQIAVLLDASVDFFRGRDLLDWRHENVQALRATIGKMHAWGFDFGETMIRIAIAARRPADMVNPTKLAALKNVARFAGWPDGGTLSEAMERAYRNLSWKA